ncbi:MAG: hypothetical protein FWC93_05020, partial [Defluviitaleaceae bacterium]|nr:hypothetical protein [Defluviitaleaceae bacterium]
MNRLKKLASFLIVAMGLIFLTGCDSPRHTAEATPSEIFHNFFANNFHIIEYEGIHGPWQLWGRNTQGETRLTKIVIINQIDEFEHPVLALGEFALQNDNTPGPGFLNAYLIRDGRLKSDITQAESYAIFRDHGNYAEGWHALRADGSTFIASVQGENLLFFDFSGDVRTDG